MLCLWVVTTGIFTRKKQQAKPKNGFRELEANKYNIALLNNNPKYGHKSSNPVSMQGPITHPVSF